jgi:hypothetical protein
MCQTNMVENFRTHVLCSMTFFVFRKLYCLYEIMWKYMVRTGHRIRCIHFACWITKATDTHSEYVAYITFPWQQRLCECARTLHYMYICFSVHLFHAYCMSCLSHASLFYHINNIWWRIHIRKLLLILQFYQSFGYTFSVWYFVLLPLMRCPK